MAEASSATAQLQQLGPASSQQAAQALAAQAGGQAPSGEVLTFNFGAHAAPAQQQQAPAPAPAQQAAAEGGPTITVVYETGWGAAFLHHCAGAAGVLRPGHE